jgi:sugar phosphate isomerase/epimerase
MKSSRRNFLRLSGIGILASQMTGVLASDRKLKPATPQSKPPFQLGIASYTFKEFNLEQVIQMTSGLGIKKLALKSMHLPLDFSEEEIKEAEKKISSAGIDLYGAGVIYMNSKDEVDQAFTYAKAAGLDTIIGVPGHSLLDYCSLKVQEYAINLAIHNHGPGDELYPSPASVFEKIKDLNPGMGLCVDIGHTQRIGQDPVYETAKYIERVHDIHIKDVDKSEASGTTVEMGRGIIDIPGFLKMLKAMNYSKVLSFEYEKDENNPLAGLAESIGYVRGVLRAI